MPSPTDKATLDRILEVKTRVDHRREGPQFVHADFYLLFNELKRLNAELTKENDDAGRQLFEGKQEAASEVDESA